MEKRKLEALRIKWTEKLRIKNNFDVRLECIDDNAWHKTGDLKIDTDDKKVLLQLNTANPKHENLEEVIVHELMHLKLWPLDQLMETMIDAHYEKGTKAYDFAYAQFMTTLEQTTAELTKMFLLEFGENRNLSYGRCKAQTGFNALYDKLKSLE